MMMTTRSFRAAALVAMLAGCTYDPPPVAPVAAGGGGSAGGEAPSPSMVREVGRLVNEHRAARGCPALAWDDAAARAAQAHSDDMARRRFFSHTSPDGGTVVTRLRAQGVAIRAVAENIASGQPTAQEVVRGWLSSPGHRANIENCTYTRQGVGLSGTLWTHVFYTPL